MTRELAASPPAARVVVRRLVVAFALLFVVLLAPSARAGDPYLDWYTVRTPHFRVHYHGGLEVLAQRTANLAEQVHTRLVPVLGWDPHEVTHILLTDDTDSANGSARVIPFNLIRMFVTAPDDMSVLHDHDDWLLDLLTHEHVHILHLDNVHGIPALANAILGKSYAPNQAQPRWIIEGLATMLESDLTSAGRIRSTQFDMYLRTDVLEGNLAGLDQISHSPRRWPSGNLWYLYGAKFVDFITGIYGKDTWSAVSTDYGQIPLAWGINRSLRRATGRTYVQLYDAWHADMLRKYGAMAAAVRKRGLRVGKRMTFRGRSAMSPRWVPKCARSGSREELVYFADDGHDIPGLYRVPLQSRYRVATDDVRIITRTQLGNDSSFDADCGIIFDSIGATRRRYLFADLYRQPRGTRSPRGLSRSTRRLTVGRRARYPAVSPDGRRIAYVTNRAGTTTLRVARIAKDGGIIDERRLVPSARYEQAYTPRWSPDGHFIAYSAWTRGGYRDIRIVDAKSGKFIELMHDRAIDQQPVFSPDGKTLFFTSDRTGIANIYAWDLAEQKLWQVTNVISGAYMPAISEDQKSLYYIGYTKEGFDLFGMPLDRDRWLPAPPLLKERPDPPSEPKSRRYPVEKYNPLTTLRPFNYEFEYGPGAFGQALSITTTGSDAVGLHAFSATVVAETEADEPLLSAAYSYRQLPMNLNINAFRRSVPRGGYRIGDSTPRITERRTGLTTGVSYDIPGAFDSHNLGFNYTAAHYDSTLPVGDRVDPYGLVTREPHRGFLATVRLSWAYSSAQGSVYGISTERGTRMNIGLEYGAPELGSDHTLRIIDGSIRRYVPMPWNSHHVLAMALAGGASQGDYPRRGVFFTGGFVDIPVLDWYTSNLAQGGFVLRGYEPGRFVGAQFNRANLEYRFPIWYAERGIQTLPFFLRTLSGAVFADYGGAFDRVDPDDILEQYHMGVGAELWIDLTLGYFVGGNIRLGHARGVQMPDIFSADEQAVPGGQTYFIVAAPF